MLLGEHLGEELLQQVAPALPQAPPLLLSLLSLPPSSSRLLAIGPAAIVGQCVGTETGSSL